MLGKLHGVHVPTVLLSSCRHARTHTIVPVCVCVYIYIYIYIYIYTCVGILHAGDLYFVCCSIYCIHVHIYGDVNMHVHIYDSESEYSEMAGNHVS